MLLLFLPDDPHPWVSTTGLPELARPWPQPGPEPRARPGPEPGSPSPGTRQGKAPGMSPAKRVPVVDLASRWLSRFPRPSTGHTWPITLCGLGEGDGPGRTQQDPPSEISLKACEKPRGIRAEPRSRFRRVAPLGLGMGKPRPFQGRPGEPGRVRGGALRPR